MSQVPLKIVFATTSYPRRSGDYAAPFIASLAESIADLGHDVCVVAPHEPGTREREVVNGVLVRRFRYAPEWIEYVAYGSGIVENLRRRPALALELPAFALALRHAVTVEARGAHIVHAQWAQTALMIGRPHAPAKLVTTILGTDLGLADNPVWAVMLRRALRLSDSVVAVSDFFKTRLEEFLQPGTELTVIPVGLDPDLVARPADFGRPSGVPDVLCVGRVIESKGVFDLIRAFARVSVPATLSFVGTGDDIGSARSLAASLGIEERVRFEGPLSHDETLARMGRAHLVVSPSHREGFGAISAEAAAMGTPTVVTNTGDMPQYTGDPRAVVEVGDVEGLAAAIQLFLSDEGLRTASARVANAKVGGLSWESIARKTVAVYERVLDARS